MNRPIDPYHYRVVKIFKLHKRISVQTVIPFVLAYTRKITADYLSSRYKDRVDIDIFTAIQR